MKMPKELKERWVSALRSGEYKQARGELYDFRRGGYCCLGVLEMIADGKVEKEDSGRAMTMPSSQWYKDHGIIAYAEIEEVCTPGMLAEFNDSGKSFSDIADFIEEQVEVSDEG